MTKQFVTCYQSLFSYIEGPTGQAVGQEGLSHEGSMEQTRSGGEKQMRDANIQEEPLEKMNEDEKGNQLKHRHRRRHQRKGKADKQKREKQRYRRSPQRKGKADKEKWEKQRYRRSPQRKGKADKQEQQRYRRSHH